MTPADLPLRHGYSFTDIEQLANAALRNDRWRKDMDVRERHDAIRYAITEHLLTAEEPPTYRDLLKAGLKASSNFVAEEMHYRGYDDRNLAAGGGGLAGFQRYWRPAERTPFDERLVERIALGQVWETLTLAQQQALMALALTEDYRDAADSLSLSTTAFTGRMRKARRRVYALWHEHETPRRAVRDKRVFNRRPVDGRGRRRLTAAEVDVLRARRAVGGPGTTLKELAAEAGYSTAALCNLLSGKRRPAP